MTMMITAFPEEYDKSIQDRVFLGIETYFAMAAWRQYFNYSEEKSLVLKTTGYSGFDSVPQWPDGVDIPVDEAMKLWDMTITMLFYGLGFKVTRKHLEYGQLRIIQSWADSLALSVEQTYGTIHVATLDAAFTTNIAALGGVPLISASHPTAGSGTRSNLLAPAALTPANLDTLRLRAAKWVNYRGIATPIDVTGAKIIYPSNLHRTVTKILESQGEPFTTDNDINVQRGKYVSVEEPRLTSTTAYFLQCRKHGLLSNHGKLPKMIRYEENNGSLVHGVEFDCVTGVEFADGMFGCAGA
jgi:hypothetical protein